MFDRLCDFIGYMRAPENESDLDKQLRMVSNYILLALEFGVSTGFLFLMYMVFTYQLGN